MVWGNHSKNTAYYCYSLTIKTYTKYTSQLKTSWRTYPQKWKICICYSPQTLIWSFGYFWMTQCKSLEKSLKIYLYKKVITVFTLKCTENSTTLNLLHNKDHQCWIIYSAGLTGSCLCISSQFSMIAYVEKRPHTTHLWWNVCEVFLYVQFSNSL